MNPPRSGSLPGVQVLRGVAAALVLVHHVLEESQRLYGGHLPQPLVLLGASGVDIFFVISGFIMCYTNSRNFGREGAALDFFVRRIIRIVPLYWFCTFIILALWWCGLYSHRALTMPTLLQSLFFLPQPYTVVTVGWTLNYEMYFYLVFAVWLCCRSFMNGVIGTTASICLVLVIGLAAPASAARDFLANPIVLEFCFGMAIATAYRRGAFSARMAPWLLLSGVLALILGTAIGRGQGTAGLVPSERFLFWGVPSALLVMAAILVARVEGLVGRALLVLGDASYAIYLTHSFVMTAYARLLKMHLVAAPHLLLISLPIGFSLLLGLATHHFMERVSNEYLKEWWSRRWVLVPGSAR